MAIKNKQEAQNPLILRSHRLMEAFAKSDDERDFFLDRLEGFIVYADLDKPETELHLLETEIASNKDRYCMIPKLTFYETKKIMEGFVNEKVYDIDTKEKLLDIIQSKEARDNFLEFIFDHHSEQEKWQQYYQERSRIRIIEWLRNNQFNFVFEEDLDLPKSMIEKLKKSLFDPKAGKEIITARKALSSKAKTYYSNEALNPRPKRGRPPKQAVKLEIEPQITTDIYTTVPPHIRPFLFIPEFSSSSSNFSSKFETDIDLLSHRKLNGNPNSDSSIENLNQKLASLRSISSKWIDSDTNSSAPTRPIKNENWNDEEEDEDDFDDEESNEEDFDEVISKKSKGKSSAGKSSAKPIIATKVKPKGKPAAKPNVKPNAKLKAKKPAAVAKPVKKAPLKAIKTIKAKVNAPATRNGKPVLKKISPQKSRPAQKIAPRKTR